MPAGSPISLEPISATTAAVPGPGPALFGNESLTALIDLDDDPL